MFAASLIAMQHVCSWSKYRILIEVILLCFTAFTASLVLAGTPSRSCCIVSGNILAACQVSVWDAAWGAVGYCSLCYLGRCLGYDLKVRVLFGALFGLHETGCMSCLQVILNITNTFDSSFSRWTVGLGVEHQLNELRVAAGLGEEACFRTRARNLDYAQLVQPEVAVPV